MNYTIKKAAVLGSGVMGSAIACHLANVGIEVLLLDIIPRDLDENNQSDKQSRNKIVDGALKKAIKSKPSPLYSKTFSERITTGNFEDNFSEIKDCDWIIEVVIEDLEIKKRIFSKVDKFRRKDSLISSNTSGIPIHLMLEGRSDNFQEHFIGTHFFNPPRYLRLLEIIPTAKSKPEIIDFWMEFGRSRLGKETILCKDTPAFIANRIGVFAMAKIFQLTESLGLDINTVDKLTGPGLARPKTGTFRLGDLVGMDTAVKVVQGVQYSCPKDAMVQDLKMPDAVAWMIEKGFFGNKSGQGFYKKTDERDKNGKRIIKSLDLNTNEYVEKASVNYSSLETSKNIEDPEKRIRALVEENDPGGELIRQSLAYLLSYAAQRIPEISDQVYSVDRALRAGFAWKFGPFEYWDILGFAKGKALIEKYGLEIPEWTRVFEQSGQKSFYQYKGSKRQCWNPLSASMEDMPGPDGFVDLRAFKNQEPVYKNAEVILHDIGDQVLCLEFNSKMNTIGEGVLRGVNDAIDLMEAGDWRGLVIGNVADNFSVGANLMLIAMMAYNQEFDELNFAVDFFQKTSMRCRYASKPVVSATQGYVFGGGCEMSMHCDAIVAAAESYIGLVEVGVGVIPGGGGTKEFALRVSDSFFEGDVQMPTLIKYFKTIAMGQVATSALEAFEFGYMIENRDEVSVNGPMNISGAKSKVIEMSKKYIPLNPRTDIHVLGQSGLATLYTASNELKRGNWASEHDIKIAHKLANVMCGGPLSAPQKVSEQYLLDLEREAFLSLCGEQKTLERIQHMIQYNKPLRN
jgi:3-hydroxyacyl-CoA dehydrogenase